MSLDCPIAHQCVIVSIFLIVNLKVKCLFREIASMFPPFTSNNMQMYFPFNEDKASGRRRP